MFETLYTTKIVAALFVIGSFLIIGGALYTMQQYGQGFAWYTLLGAAFSIVVLRLVCEWIVVQFRIYETLKDIKHQGFLRDLKD